MYLEVVGTMSVEDRCGPIGSILSNPFIGFAPGVLSTYSPPYPFTEGQGFQDPQGILGGMFVGDAKPLNIPELECPTFGVGRATRSGKPIVTIGPPWLPLIIPAKEAFSLDPEWSRLCPGILSYAAGMESFAIFDPPRILVPGTGMKPNPTDPLPAGETPESPLDNPVLQPGQAPKPDTPKQTAVAGAVMVAPEADPDPQTEQHQDDPSSAQTVPPSSAGTDVQPSSPGANVAPKTGDDAKDPEDPAEGDGTDPKKDPGSSVEAPNQAGKSGPQPASGSGTESPSLGENKVNSLGADPARTPDPASGDKADPNAASQANAAPQGNAAPESNAIPQVNDGPPNTPSQGLSDIVKPGSEVLAAQAAAPPQIMTVGSQTFAPNPGGFNVGPNDITPGGPAAIIAGTPISLGSSGDLVVGSSTVNIAPSPTPGAQNLNVGGQTFVPAPAGFEVGGQQVRPANAAVTVAGTPISLGTAGNLVVGSSTININTADSAVTPVYQAFSAGGQTFTPNPTGFVVASQTLTPGAPAAIVAGTAISLGTAGHLTIGSATVSLAPSVAPVLNVGHQTFSASAGGFKIADTSVLPGSAAVTISGTAVSLGSSGQLVVGSQTIALPTPYTSIPNVVTVKGQAVSANPSGFVLDGKSVLPGGSAVIVGGTPVTLGTDGVLDVGGSKTILTGATGSGVATYLGSSAAVDTVSLWCKLITMSVALWSVAIHA